MNHNEETPMEVDSDLGCRWCETQFEEEWQRAEHNDQHYVSRQQLFQCPICEFYAPNIGLHFKAIHRMCDWCGFPGDHPTCGTVRKERIRKMAGVVIKSSSFAQK